MSRFTDLLVLERFLRSNQSGLGGGGSGLSNLESGLDNSLGFRSLGLGDGRLRDRGTLNGDLECGNFLRKLFRLLGGLSDDDEGDLDRGSAETTAASISDGDLKRK
jgi:hypothetical protein